MLDAAVVQIVNLAASDEFDAIAVQTLDEIPEAVSQSRASAVLFSPSLIRDQSRAALGRVLARLPSVTFIAVFADDGASAHADLLYLGACGVRWTVSLKQREGWNQLRSLVREAGDEVTRTILRSLEGISSSVSVEARLFLAAMVRLAPSTGTIRAFSRAIGINASTLVSRFFRARLPPPKTYLAMTRLLFAAAYFESKPVSIASVADCLSYSSPQSFGRHIGGVLGLTAGEFRQEFTLSTAVSHFVERLIVPYEKTLATFDPLGSGPIEPAHRYRPTRDIVLVAAERRNTNA
jgi:hypothetical protein